MKKWLNCERRATRSCAKCLARFLVSHIFYANSDIYSFFPFFYFLESSLTAKVHSQVYSQVSDFNEEEERYINYSTCKNKINFRGNKTSGARERIYFTFPFLFLRKRERERESTLSPSVLRFPPRSIYISHGTFKFMFLNLRFIPLKE